ncbi:uncharacterized protein [Mytilus edulis]|uniref:uncharacterized protein isoform X1 n=1 Tax=Mytilus edulis TaxID=6550 RepID=UPI0039EFEE39
MEQDPKKKDRRRQKKMDSKPDSRKPSVSAEGRQQSAAVENETGKPVVAPPQEEEFSTEIKKEEPKTETKRTVQVEKREHQTTEFTMVDPKEYGIEIEEEEFKFGKNFLKI